MPIEIALSIIFLIGFLQALIVMPFSAKIVFACLPQSSQSFMTYLASYIFAVYAIISWFLAILVVVVIPIWWNS